MFGELTLGAALLLGAAGSGHCLAMCGGITAHLASRALNDSDPIAAGGPRRIGGYATLGGLVCLMGAGAAGWLQQPAGYWTLRALAALTLILMGLQLAGWARLLDRMATIGAPLWRRLQPLSRRLLPIDSAAKALAFGALWGLLPCGLVYGMLTLSIGFASPVQGALFMGAFGLGTLPALLGLAVAPAGFRPALCARDNGSVDCWWHWPVLLHRAVGVAGSRAAGGAAALLNCHYLERGASASQVLLDLRQDRSALAPIWVKAEKTADKPAPPAAVIFWERVYPAKGRGQARLGRNPHRSASSSPITETTDAPRKLAHPPPTSTMPASSAPSTPPSPELKPYSNPGHARRCVREELADAWMLALGTRRR
jgi:hypothetical protein